MRRREFIALVGGMVASWPLAARAQQASKLPVIGFLGSGTASSQGTWVAAFGRRLSELGWVEGRNVAIEYRWAEGQPTRFAEIADEFVRLKVDIIFAVGTEPALAAHKATPIIPIIFPLASDPIAAGLVVGLARPGGNVTGLSNQAADLVSKRLGILREVVPGLRRLAIIANADGPSAMLEMRECSAAAGTLGLSVLPLEIRRTADIAPNFASIKDHADALYVVGDPLLHFNLVRINTFALVSRLPTTSARWT